MADEAEAYIERAIALPRCAMKTETLPEAYPEKMPDHLSHYVCIECNGRNPEFGQPVETICGQLHLFDYWNEAAGNDCIPCKEGWCRYCGGEE